MGRVIYRQPRAVHIYIIGVGTKFALGGPLSVMPSLLHLTHANAQQASHVCVLVLYSVGCECACYV